jgi:hypothetical protein
MIVASMTLVMGYCWLEASAMAGLLMNPGSVATLKVVVPVPWAVRVMRSSTPEPKS